jgi:fructose 1,6-bisphosphate aldolase/phosphatase
MFDAPSCDEARREAYLLAVHLRRLRPFEPHRLPLEEMEYTSLPQVMQRVEDR